MGQAAYKMPEQQQMILPQEEEFVQEEEFTQEIETPDSVEIETPLFKVSYENGFAVLGICLIILLIGVVKKYFWNKVE